MPILAIETSTNACSAALMLNNTTVQERYQLAPREHANLILPMIDSLLAEANMGLTNLDAIAFGQGPGSFTGVRVAAGIVQGLAFAADLPVVPVSSLKALAQTAYAEQKCRKILAAFDARMQELYWGMYELAGDGLMQELQPDALLKPEQITNLPNDGWAGVGDGWDAHGKILQSNLAPNLTTILPQLYPHAAAIAHLATADYAAGKAVAAEQALPIYLRAAV